MKFPVVLIAPTLTLFAFNALAQEAPAAPAAPPATAPDAAAPATAATPAPLPAPTPAPVDSAPQPVTPEPVAIAPAAVAPVSPLAPMAPPGGAVANDGFPLAGWHNGLFFLRDTSDNYRLYVQGRAQVDFYSYAGPGVSDVASLKPTLFLRRIRPEITGEFFHSVWFSIAGDFGATGNDNAGGTNETSAAAPGKAPDATTGKYASAQTARIIAAPTDVFLNFRGDPLLNVQVGQFDAPFTMENRTSDKFIPFMERSLAVRDVGISTNKEIGVMVWGELPSKYWFYSAGIFNGDGQNKLNVDSRGDEMIRTFVHPLADSKSELKDLQIGASFRYGSRDKKYSFYDYNSMSTQGNYTFWKPTYGGSEGTTHILPSGNQVGVAGELRVPVSMFDFTSEVVYINNQTRETQEGIPAVTLRRGEMKGVSYYLQAGVWLGKRDISGLPGYENMPHVDFSKPDPDPTHAVQLLAKWEQVHLSYNGSDRAGTQDVKNADGDIKVNAFSLGANYWMSKHVRLSANYVLNIFPDSAIKSTPSQRATAPGNSVAKDDAHNLHEFLLRAAVAL